METQSRKFTEQLLIRLPDGWRDAIKIEAARNHRSMNAEILSAVEFAMKEKGVQLEQSAS